MITLININGWFGFIFFSIVIAFISTAWIKVILDSDVGSWFYKWAHKRFSGIAPTPNKWIWKPVFDCVYCNSGQLALWFYIVKSIYDGYSLIVHLAFILATIGTAYYINK